VGEVGRGVSADCKEADDDDTSEHNEASELALIMLGNGNADDVALERTEDIFEDEFDGGITPEDSDSTCSLFKVDLV